METHFYFQSSFLLIPKDLGPCHLCESAGLGSWLYSPSVVIANAGLFLLMYLLEWPGAMLVLSQWELSTRPGLVSILFL